LINDCLFCRIFARLTPANIVYEDANTMGFMDAFPRLAKAQCVVIHKKHVDQFYQLEDNELAEMMIAAKRVALKIQKVYSSKYTCVFSRGQTVPHAHIIVYPSEPLCTLDGVLKSLETMRQLTLDTSSTGLEETARKLSQA
jgi:histidine triad (HIT) family protein